jgi:hypothetical protein
LIITNFEENIRHKRFDKFDKRTKEEALTYYYDDE